MPSGYPFIPAPYTVPTRPRAAGLSKGWVYTRFQWFLAVFAAGAVWATGRASAGVASRLSSIVALAAARIRMLTVSSRGLELGGTTKRSAGF